MAKKTYDLLFKLLLIGDSGVGKTCILFRFSDDAFSTTFISTIGIDFKIKTVELRGKKIKLQIWDTAGQERFHTITTSYYRGAMGIMLVYDITNEKTFENIVKWLRNIDEHANEDVEKMILGNKSDMEEKRVVSTEKGEAIAREHGIRFMETSAKANINIDRAFSELAEAILDKTHGKEPQDAPDRVTVDRRVERTFFKLYLYINVNNFIKLRTQFYICNCIYECTCDGQNFITLYGWQEKRRTFMLHINIKHWCTNKK
ncbi:hypothetical protein PUN28_006460 [Cardiocondyla obscurior]|uniref:Ras-related protein Rab-10 n=1 Tax=Cardiocondyla obscurior TaxID=286306 RepID=A0AAW2G9C4_9HYME